MATCWKNTLIPTLRQVPAEAEVPSHQLMLRAGYIRRLGSGIYEYLPLGWRSLRRATAIVRREMDAAGAAEVFLPVLQPVELWERTGRRTDYGQNLFVVRDRHGREQALGPTHEEVITELAAACIESYKNLPLNLYQIQTKFRDEFRPRFGVLRSREFQMKDAYSFHLDLDGPGGLDAEYQKMYDTYCRIFDACSLPYEVVEAESGEMGGSGSHQFTVLATTGEDTIFKSDRGNYAANLERCEIGQRPHDFAGEPTGDLEPVHTPNCPGIDDVRAFFKKSLGSKLKPESMLKSLVYTATRLDDHPDPREARDPWYLLAVVRGDHDVNEEKLRACATQLLDAPATIGLAPEDLARADGWNLGFVGPHAVNGRDDTHLVVDPDAAGGGFWVTGANEADHHVKHFNWKRDVLERDQGAEGPRGPGGEGCAAAPARGTGPGDDAGAGSAERSDSDHSAPRPLGPSAPAGAAGRVHVADIRNAIDGDPSPKNDGGTLRASRGIEVGQVFKLGSKYSVALDAAALDDNNQRRPLVMGCYGIGINRILGAAVERTGGHDESGIIWPRALAPFDVIITGIKYAPGGEVESVCRQIAGQIEAGGAEVLIDDRDERPGVKFNDADLVGIPLRITVGEKGLGEGIVELKARDGSLDTKAPVGGAAAAALEALKTL